MFALHTPQTITLAVPGEDGPFTTINFKTNGADTSRCVMEIVTPEGNVHRATFATRGALIDVQFVPADHPDNEVHEPLSGQDYMVGGRDTRADNPYTHVAPVDADTAYRDGATPGFRSPEPESDEDRERREQANREAAEAKRELRRQAQERRDAGLQQSDRDLPEDERRRREENRKAAEHDYSAVGAYGDSTDRYPEPEIATGKTFPEPGTARRDPASDDPAFRDDREIPAPSTGLPGGEPAHPESVQAVTERQNINTSRTLSNPPIGRRPVGTRPVEEV